MSLAFRILGSLRPAGRAERRTCPRHWRAAEGVTQGGRVTFGAAVNQVMAEVDYAFTVKQDHYTGQFLAGPFAVSEDAMAYLETFGEYQKIVVRYDPENPFKSVLDPGKQPCEIAAGALVPAPAIKPA